MCDKEEFYSVWPTILCPTIRAVVVTCLKEHRQQDSHTELCRQLEGTESLLVTLRLQLSRPAGT